jgi:small conductance mechanosensitive channel
MEDTLQKIYDLFTFYGIKVIAAIAIFVVGRWIAKGFRSISTRLWTREVLKPSFPGLLET